MPLRDMTVMDDMMIMGVMGVMMIMEVMTNMGWKNSNLMTYTMITDIDMGTTATVITKNFDKDSFFSILVNMNQLSTRACFCSMFRSTREEILMSA